MVSASFNQTNRNYDNMMPPIVCLPVEDVKETKFAKYNPGEHLCVDIPDGHFTISARTSEGEKITFAFVPYKENGPAQCVDVEHHTSGKTVMNGSIELNVQKVICFTIGYDTFRSNLDDEKPTTLTTILLHD